MYVYVCLYIYNRNFSILSCAWADAGYVSVSGLKSAAKSCLFRHDSTRHLMNCWGRGRCACPVGRLNGGWCAEWGVGAVSHT